MPTISLCMIVKDEEEVLDQCLNSVKEVCDEIVIVDTGSIDRTKQIASKFTDKIFDFTWVEDFSAARNYSFSLANMEYILWLDADDLVQKEDFEKLSKLKNELDESIDAVSMNYDISFDASGNTTFKLRRNRLVKKSKQYQWIGVVHEYLDVQGNILESDIVITHTRHLRKQNTDTNRNLRIYEAQLKQGKLLSPRDLYYYANELKDHRKYKRAILYYEKFLSLYQGWMEDKVMACLYLADCYQEIGAKEKVMDILLETFKYDNPRPEACCRIGDHFRKNEKYHTAIFWYQTATQVPIDHIRGFYQPSYSTWIPHLHMCVCHWKLGNVEKAIEHNSIAGTHKPEDESVLNNKKFFSDYLKEKRSE
ncbi:glycosyltransferase family 2 protein [Halobacillus yeomjeoni]|uniref:tetratricopeptide repeat-containing glycosyltransferase family 2 protein n=1 Tax=Halobacillus yeomjeoni TaxID=311194 RepID=UPI001CD455DB|nr:glycosyltransferase family 2 protein [Halobacillus yeomjeoni]MCA0984219.1 glycosyltransferase family 2 protein [Halobacillus yeomjeoni]